MNIICDYRDNDELRKSFFRLAYSIFGINFENWYNLGYWNDNYKCYSFIDNNAVISNASASYMDIMMNGQPHKFIQIGTVMTHPSYRGKGLAGKLIGHICSNSKLPLILFAEETNRSFYEHQGFTLKTQYTYTYTRENCKVKCMHTEHWDMGKRKYRALLLEKYKKKRAFNNFDVINGQHILFFHLLNNESIHVDYCREIDTIIIYSDNGNTLHIYAIIHSEMQSFEDIIALLPETNSNTVKFMFTPPVKWREYMDRDIINDKNNLLFKNKTDSLPTGIHVPDIFIA